MSTINCNSSYRHDEMLAEFDNSTSLTYDSTNAFYISEAMSISTYYSTFTQCGISEDGGIFRIVGKVSFYD